MEIDLTGLDHDPFPAGYDEDATLLFSESTTRFLVEVEAGKKFNFQTKMMGHAVTPLGRLITSPRLKIKGRTGELLVDVAIERLREAFTGGFQG
jgi:hypothetical protein